MKVVIAKQCPHVSQFAEVESFLTKRADVIICEYGGVRYEDEDDEDRDAPLGPAVFWKACWVYTSSPEITKRLVQDGFSRGWDSLGKSGPPFYIGVDFSAAKVIGELKAAFPEEEIFVERGESISSL